MMIRSRMMGVVAVVCVAAWSGAAGAAEGPGKPFVHPGMLQSRDELEFMKRKVMAGEQPWKDAWERLIGGRDGSLDFKPRPFAHVIRGPYNNPAIGSNEISQSADGAYCHALQWYITGDKAHARKAIEILNAWSPVLRDFQQNDAKLLAGWTGHAFLNAAEILRCTDSGWEEKDVEQFRKMIMGVYYPLIKDFFPEANGNWDAAMINAMLCIGIFMDDRAVFDRAVEQYLRGPVNGGITHYVYPSGQCEESTRDQGHTQLGLGELAQACKVAWTQGVDLYGAADNRLALGYEYTAKYLLGEDVACEDVISPVGRGRLSDIYQGVYQHYRFVKGLEMPYTAKAAERTLDRSRGVLMFYQGPGPQSPAVRAGEPRASTVAASGGAMAEASGRPAAGAVMVAVGQSIQAALDGAKPGQWVVLGKGVHTLPEALRLHSGVTLAGEGGLTVVMLDSKLSGPTIVNDKEELHDVVVRDLIVEGAKSSRLPSDPNAARRGRNKAGAPSRGGMRLAAGNGQTMRKIRLEHITVRNCTETGVSIEGAAEVAIVGCSFTDSGAKAAPGAGLNHCLSLVRVAGCRIEGSRLNNSPAGCGVSIAEGRDITLEGDEIARSVGQGARAADSQAVRIVGCLIEGNEAGGVLLGVGTEGCRGVEVRDNLLRNNGGLAIEIRRAVGGAVQGNRLADNAQADAIAVLDSQGIAR